MKKFKYKYGFSGELKGWTDGNLVTFDYEDPTTLHILEYISQGDYADMALERIIEGILFKHSYKKLLKKNKIKNNKKNWLDSLDI